MGPPLLGSERLLLRVPSWLGDFVASEPLVRALAARLSGGELTLAGRAAHLKLLEGRFPRVSRLPLEEGNGGWSGHDVALLCTGSFRSSWTAWRAGIPRRVGFARDGRGAWLTDAITPARERGGVPCGLGRAGAGRRFLPRPLERSLTELAGLLGVQIHGARPRVEPLDPWLQRARLRRKSLGLEPEEPYVLANVGAREGSAKGYPPERWARVLSELESESGLPVLLLCGPGEESILMSVARGLGVVRAVLDPPADLTELAALCAEARLVLTADSGPRHVARAVGAAVVALAGPSDPRHTCGERAREPLLRMPVSCGPCHREQCPLVGPRRHACMTGIEPEGLLALALERLGAP